MKRAVGRTMDVGLDVGSTEICVIIAEVGGTGALDVVGVGASPSRGLRKGVVVNIDSTVEAIRKAVDEAEQMAGTEISAVYAGLAGGHIRGLNSRGVLGVSGKHREVGALDIERALEDPLEERPQVRGADLAQRPAALPHERAGGGEQSELGVELSERHRAPVSTGEGEQNGKRDEALEGRQQAQSDDQDDPVAPEEIGDDEP